MSVKEDAPNKINEFHNFLINVFIFIFFQFAVSYSKSTSLLVVGAKRMLPIGLNACVSDEHKLAQYVKQALLAKKNESVIADYVEIELHGMQMLEDYEFNDGKKDIEKRKEVIMKLGSVLAHLYLVDHAQAGGKAVWEKLLSRQRKRAIVSCFRMTPLYNTPRHKVINTWCFCYRDLWLKTEQIDFASQLVNELANPNFNPNEEPEEEISNSALACMKPLKEAEVQEVKRGSDPLYQLIQLFSSSAVTSTRGLDADELYLAYSELLSMSCHTDDELEEQQNESESDANDDDEDDLDDFEVKEREKQRLLYEQDRLASRGAAEMILYMISASNGQNSDMVMAALKLGIALLGGGNEIVQARMLEHLQEKKDSKFFTSLSALMAMCTVLDLDAYERSIKAESLGTLAQESGVLARKYRTRIRFGLSDERTPFKLSG